MPVRGLVKGMWGRKRTIAIGAIGAAALLVVVQASAGSSAVGAPELKVPPRAAAAKGVGGSLQGIVRTARIDGPSAAAGLARDSGVEVTARGARVVVVPGSGGVAATRSAVEAHGGVVELVAGGLVQALVPVADLKALGADPAVALVRRPYLHVPDDVTGEEIAAMNASGYTNAGYTGAGVKIGIIDGGFAGYASRLGTELPASVTTADFCGNQLSTATDHGTAVAEIVHEVAPGAQLYLICFETDVQLAQAEAYAKAQGIKIINHSVSWFDTSRGDGSGGPGTPDAIVADAKSNGILWVNAAGNQGQNHWSGNFVPDDPSVAFPFNVFGPGGNILNRFTIEQGAQACIGLKWDNWPTTTNDYDMYLVRTAAPAAIVDASETFQSPSGAPPFEEICYTNPDPTQEFGIKIRRFASASSPRFDMFVLGTGPIQYQTAAGSVTEPGSSPNALAVGAVCWSGFGLEPYSSRGPNINGVIKPDMSGFDSVSSSTYGAFGGCGSAGGFAGTSAASPGIAGAAALFLQQNPALTPTALQAKIQSSVVDLGTAGMDNLFGSGRLLFPTLPANTALPMISGTIAVGDTLTATDGTWSGVPAPTFTYQWRTCDPQVSIASISPGRSASTHVITSNDRGHTLRIVVRGTNTAGFSTATSAETGIPGPPVERDTPVDQRDDPDGIHAHREYRHMARRAHADVHLPVGAVQRGRYGMHRPTATASTYVPGRCRSRTDAPGQGECFQHGRMPGGGRVRADRRYHLTAGRRWRWRGGGGGGGSNDLVTAVTVDRTTAPVGGSYVWRINVTNVGGGIAFGVNVDVAMSANIVYGFSQVNRGSGCKPAATAGHLHVQPRPPRPRGRQHGPGRDRPRHERDGRRPGVAVGDVRRFAEIDPTPTNNTVTLTANNSTQPVGPTPTPTPTPAAPKLSRTGTATVKPVHHAHDGDRQLRRQAQPRRKVTMTIKVKAGRGRCCSGPDRSSARRRARRAPTP